MSPEPFVSRAKVPPTKRNEKGYGDENGQVLVLTNNSGIPEKLVNPIIFTYHVKCTFIVTCGLKPTATFVIFHFADAF